MLFRSPQNPKTPFSLIYNNNMKDKSKRSPGEEWITKTCWTRLKTYCGWFCVFFYTWNISYHFYFFVWFFMRDFAFTGELNLVFAWIWVPLCLVTISRNIYLYFSTFWMKGETIESLRQSQYSYEKRRIKESKLYLE